MIIDGLAAPAAGAVSKRLPFAYALTRSKTPTRAAAVPTAMIAMINDS